jgi:hypothetical protein
MRHTDQPGQAGTGRDRLEAKRASTQGQWMVVLLTFVQSQGDRGHACWTLPGP